MKYKAILRPSFKKCLLAPLHTISVGRDFFHLPEGTSSDLNAVANSAGPDGLPSYTGSFNSV